MSPSALPRRDFLRGALGLGAFYLSGCGGNRESRSDSPVGFDGSGKLPGTSLDDPFAAGEYLGPWKFENDNHALIGQKRQKGHDCRQSIDLAWLIEPATRLTPTEKFYIRTDFPDLLDPKVPWRVKIEGHVRETKEIPLAQLEALAEPQGAVLLECAGNTEGLAFGLLSVASWAGVPFSKILELAAPTPQAKRVLISGFDERTTTSKNSHSLPGASWIFTFDELARAKAFLATHINGVPLPPDHGAPLRLIIPNWYGCCDIKWLNEIRFVDDDEPATLQMIEFSGRTHQDIDPEKLPKGQPVLARQFIPATMDLAAIPVRIERWKIGGKRACRVLGITWGGEKPSDSLSIRFGTSEEWQPVSACVPQLPDLPFGIWCHRWQPERKGNYTVTLKFADRSIRTRRMDTNYYARRVRIPEV